MTTIHLSPREIRLVVGRVLWLTGLDVGAAPAVREYVVTAEAAGLNGLQALHNEFERLRTDAGRSFEHRVDGAEVAIDAVGLHAFSVAPGIHDLATVIALRHGRARLRVHNVTAPQLLAGLTEATSGRVRLAVQAEPMGRCQVEATPMTADAECAAAERARARAATLNQHGLEVPTELWWNLFHLSNRALTPDSFISRTHTGRSVFNEKGEIIGELGEDWHGPVPASV